MAPPPRKSGGMLVPVIAIIGVILVLAIVATGLLIVASGNKGNSGSSNTPVATASSTIATPSGTPVKTANPSPTPGGKNTIVLTPTSWSCSAAAKSISVTIRLASTFAASDMLYPELDGTAGTGAAVSANFTKQSDGTWKETETLTTSDFCGSYAIGTHAIGLQDADGVIITETSFTMNA
jgi:hypothetical protein